MKKIICIILFLNLSLFSIAQTRLSEYVSQGTNADYYTASVNELSYLIKVDQNNIIHVSKIIDQNTIEELHSRKFEGLYRNRDINFYRSSMIFAAGTEIITYDFLENEMSAASFPTGYYFVQQIDTFKNAVLFRLQNKALNDNINAVYSDEIGVRVFEDFSTYHLFGDYVMDSEVFSSNDRTYILKNYKTNESDTLLEHGADILFPAIDNDKIYYSDNDGNVLYYNLLTNTKVFLDNITITHTGRRHFFLRDNKLIVSINYFNESTIIIYDLENNQIESTTTVDTDNAFLTNVRIDNNVIISSDQRSCLLFKLDNREFLFFDSTIENNSEIKITENTFIINTYLSQIEVGFQFQKIDISTLQVENFDGIFDLGYPYQNNFVKINDTQYVATLSRMDNKLKPIYNLDFENMEASYNEIFDETTNGFYDRSQLVKLSNGINLLADSFYHVSNTDLLPFADRSEIQPVFFTSQIVENGKACFVNNSPKSIICSDGLTATLEVDLSIFQNEFIGDFAVHEDFIVFTTELFGFGNLYLYNRDDNSTIVLGETNFAENFHNMIAFGDYIYYVLESNLYRTDGENIELVSAFYDDSFIETSLLLFNNDLLFATTTGISKIDIAGNVTDVISESSLNFSFNTYNLSSDKNNLIIISKNNLFHYDGISINKVELEFAINAQAKETQNGYFLITESTTGDSKYSYYDPYRKNYAQLPEDLIDEVIIDFFDFQDKSFLLLGKNLGTINTLEIIESDSILSTGNLIQSIDHTGFYTYINLYTSINETIIYTTEDILYMDSDLQITALANIKGSDFTNRMIEEDGLIYFMAHDLNLGRQLYFLDPSNIVHNDNLLTSKDLKLTLYPNPSNNYITIDGIDLDNLHFRIISITGQIILEKKYEKNISINDLKNGTYILQLLKDGRPFKSQKFIKQ